MTKKLTQRILFAWSLLMVVQMMAYSQVPIVSSSINSDGQIQLVVNSSADKYYILEVRHEAQGEFDNFVSMTLGQAGSTTITESLAAYPLDHYQVLEYDIDTPADTDDDGVDDLTEYQNIPTQSPLNAAVPIDEEDGLTAIDSFFTFKALSITHDLVQWSEFLNDKVFVKFMIVDFNSSHPKTYFVNSNVHDLHADFAAAIGIENLGDNVKKGQIIYHPTAISNNGTLGAYAFNYSNGHGQAFEVVQKTQEILAANMPFLQNNMSHFITENNQDEYERDADLYDASRVPVLIEEDVYGDVDYWGLNAAEGYGFFREVSLEEIPDARDIVLYASLPNSLPRVSGIMTSAIQTPLSHVNLRAIQQGIPNAFIRDPLANDTIANLLNKYIYFKVEQDKYFIREATQDEFNDWFDSVRPKEDLIPPLNLDYTDILPLEDISFDMFDGFGAKCTNVATMRTFGFPEGTIPNGYGVPFYYYQEFMKANGFFEEVRSIISEPDFIADRNVRNDRLDAFRDKIKDSELPDWMMTELGTMQNLFPKGTSIRCRSSTNNEDLPGFNGAGLYTSKTQHPEEGHIAKSIKQVFASLWSLRAYDERDFYRVDHFLASMGVLCHPNYEDEKANGVGVSIDPLYNTENTFYLNSQVGEELITNPGSASIPEEILLDKSVGSKNDFIVIQGSNFLPSDSIILSAPYREQMRDYLNVIHDEFYKLYNATDQDGFAMDIEYKITSDDRLIIKQARPWSSFNPQTDLDSDPTAPSDYSLFTFPNPAYDLMEVRCDNCDLSTLVITDMLGKQLTIDIVNMVEEQEAQLRVGFLPAGIYILSAQYKDQDDTYIHKFIKH